MMSMRSLSTDLSASGGGAPSTATESYSSLRATRSVRVSEAPVSGPVALFRSRATARMCTMSPGLNLRSSRRSVPCTEAVREFFESTRPMTPLRKVKLSPSPELMMYSSHASASPKSSRASALSASEPEGVRNTVSCIGASNVTTGAESGRGSRITRRWKVRSASESAVAFAGMRNSARQRPSSPVTGIDVRIETHRDPGGSALSRDGDAARNEAWDRAGLFEGALRQSRVRRRRDRGTERH